jgi:hypothetical protein
MGASRIAQRLEKLSEQPLTAEALATAQLITLVSAERLGKGAFAQGISPLLAELNFCPEYIIDAARWLTAPESLVGD